jgi:hypothetical protein
MTLMLLIKYLIMNPSDKNVDKTKLWKSLYECVKVSLTCIHVCPELPLIITVPPCEKKEKKIVPKKFFLLQKYFPIVFF